VSETDAGKVEYLRICSSQGLFIGGWAGGRSAGAGKQAKKDGRKKSKVKIK